MATTGGPPSRCSCRRSRGPSLWCSVAMKREPIGEAEWLVCTRCPIFFYGLVQRKTRRSEMPMTVIGGGSYWGRFTTSFFFGVVVTRGQS